MAHATDRAPVLSLTVIDGASLRDGLISDSTRVLVAVREAATNPTHPNVVSVPTHRVPQALFDAMTTAAGRTSHDPARRATHFAAPPVDSACDSGHDPVIYATESLLAGKLDLADALERGLVRFRAALRGVVVGTAVYEGESGAPLSSEPINMLNVLVEVVAGADRVPVRTSSYSHVGWAELARFLEGVERRDPMMFHSEMDPIELCVHGVCLAAAQATLLEARGGAPFSPSGEGGRCQASYVARFPDHIAR